MYLVNTNIWLERFLEQEKSEEVAKFLSSVPSSKLCITDFSFHSIAIILTKLKEIDALKKFIQDVFVEGEVSLLTLSPMEIFEVLAVMEKFKLDFDDAYQYVTAEKYDLVLVSFDSDFDVTERKRVTPAEVLK